jgi:hypothetical protein
METVQVRRDEFNMALVDAIDQSICDLVGQKVLDTMHTVLMKRFDIPRDEIPCRLESFQRILTETFGLRGCATITRVIARRFYDRLDLRYDDLQGFSLMDYVQIAKNRLAQRERS